MHEHSPRHASPIQSSSDRSFGFVFAAVFLIIGLYPLLHASGIRLWAVAMSGMFLLLAALRPQRVAALVTVCTNPRFVAEPGWPGMEAAVFFPRRHPYRPADAALRQGSLAPAF